MVNLLVVEDEERIASFLSKGLRAHGYGVEWVRSGREGLERATDADISLVILDLGLPDLDGLEVLKGMRERGATLPVLVLSARGGVDDRVRGLNLGADDYLTKPFAFEELLARVRANLRSHIDLPPNVNLRVGGLRVDLLLRKVTVDGRSVSLSSREFSLLKTFVAHPGQILSRQELLSMAWGMHFDTGTNLVDVYVRYLRRKLGERVIETVHGAGYRLRLDRQASSRTDVHEQQLQVAAQNDPDSLPSRPGPHRLPEVSIRRVLNASTRGHLAVCDGRRRFREQPCWSGQAA